jgi:hypothetical protein
VKEVGEVLVYRNANKYCLWSTTDIHSENAMAVAELYLDRLSARTCLPNCFGTVRAESKGVIVTAGRPATRLNSNTIPVRGSTHEFAR